MKGEKGVKNFSIGQSRASACTQHRAEVDQAEGRLQTDMLFLSIYAQCRNTI